MNFSILFASALIPMVIGAVWYNVIFKSAWMTASGMTEEKIKTGNAALILGLAYLFSFFLAFALYGLCVHQMGIGQLFGTAPAGSEEQALLSDIMEKYGDRHRTFGHGALHGGIGAILFALPLIGILSLFERRGWRYVMLHFGYWFIAMTLMGGVICQFA